MKLVLLKLFVLTLIFIASLDAIAQTPLPSLIPYRKGDLWGYADSNKVVKIKPIFTRVEWFDELGKAKVKYISQTDSVEDRFIDSAGNLIPKGYGNFGKLFYYRAQNDSVWLVDKITKKKTVYPFLLKYQQEDITLKTLAYKKGKKVHIYKDNGEHLSFKLSKINFIKRIIDKRSLFYVLKKDTTIQILGLGTGIIYVAKNGAEYLKLNHKKRSQKIKGVLRVHELTKDYFIINEGKEKQVYNQKGEKVFSLKTKNLLSFFGKNFFAEYSYTEGYKNGIANIINIKGEYIKKGISLTEKGSYMAISKGVYYRVNNSCFLFQDTSGDTTTICGNGRQMQVLRVNKNFIVLQNTDTTINVYNNSGDLLLENWNETVCDYKERSIKYHVIGEEYFPLTVNGQSAIMDKEGEITILKTGYSPGMAVGKFFLTADMGGINLIDSTGTTIKHYNFIDNTPMGTYPQHFFVVGLQNMLSRNHLQEIVITLEDRILIIRGNTYREMEAAYYRKEIGESFNGFYMDVSPWFGRIRLKKNNKHNNNYYCFIDKYGTVYYDE